MQGMQSRYAARSQNSAKQLLEEKRQPSIGFFQEGDHWFFDPEEGDSIGPFDRIYEITMGEWKNEQRELTGTEVVEVLRPYLRPRLVRTQPGGGARNPVEQPKKRVAS